MEGTLQGTCWYRESDGRRDSAGDVRYKGRYGTGDGTVQGTVRMEGMLQRDVSVQYNTIQ